MEKRDRVLGSSQSSYRAAGAAFERDLEVVCKRKNDVVLI